jgi:hypothetical protein
MARQGLFRFFDIVLGCHRHSNDKKFIEVLQHSPEKVMYSCQPVDAGRLEISYWLCESELCHGQNNAFPTSISWLFAGFETLLGTPLSSPIASLLCGSEES